VALSAIVFGSLGTLTETSDLHRRSFNQAFSELGLEWDWSPETFSALLPHIDDATRVLEFAKTHGDSSVTSTTAHELAGYKTKIYTQLVRTSPPVIRPGVLRLIESVKNEGLGLGLATSASMDDVEANLESFGGRLSLDHFDAVTTVDQLDRRKPAPDAHVVCLSRLDVRPGATVAFEDAEASVASASIAGATVVATPGDLTVDQNFSSAAVTVSSLGEPDTQAFIVGDGPALDEGMVTLNWLRRLVGRRFLVAPSARYICHRCR